jgi:predicted phosphodiesterase
MKIAIVSDTHNNRANFKKAIDWIKKDPPSGVAGKISLILHCGDISSQETIDKAKKELGYNPHSFTEGIKILEEQINEMSK